MNTASAQPIRFAIHGNKEIRQGSNNSIKPMPKVSKSLKIPQLGLVSFSFFQTFYYVDLTIYLEDMEMMNKPKFWQTYESVYMFFSDKS